MDYVNQGNGSMMEIWKTNNEMVLSNIKFRCDQAKEDFYNPTFLFRKMILREINSESKKL